jgi:hypothetical protein
MTDEAKAKQAENAANLEEKRALFANMTDETLVTTSKFYAAQMRPVNFAPGEPVYDATMWHVIVPELIRRVKARK